MFNSSNNYYYCVSKFSGLLTPWWLRCLFRLCTPYRICVGHSKVRFHFYNENFFSRWLVHTHLRNFCFKRSSMKNILKRELLMFKSMLILEKDLNTSSKYTAIPGIIYGLWAIEILAFYGGIKSVPQFFDNAFLSSLFLIGLVNTSIACVCGNTLESKLYTKSDELLWQWRRISRDRVRRREIKPLYPVRLRVGDNYVDRMTPLVAQDFIANQTVSLILL